MQYNKKGQKCENALPLVCKKDIVYTKAIIKMTIEERILNSETKVLKRDYLYQLIREFYPNYVDASIRWVIYRLVSKGVISKLDATHYIIGKINTYYQQNESDEKRKIINALNRSFPNVRVVVYESTLLNEWVNHQIARKVIFIEVEKYFINDVFRFIYNRFPKKVMLNPNNEDLYMNDGEIIIVTKLITQAPINLKTRAIKIEKLVVDLFTKDLITEFVSEDEKEDIIQAIFKTYPINVRTVYAYAKRRNNYDEINNMISKYKLGILS